MNQAGESMISCIFALILPIIASKNTNESHIGDLLLIDSVGYAFINFVDVSENVRFKC